MINRTAVYVCFHLFAELKSPLCPYGSAAMDNVLLNTDDGSTPRISFGQSFLFFGRFLTSAFVSKPKQSCCLTIKTDM